jgi:hypothetical protein
MDEKQLISRLGYMAADLAGTIEGDAADAAIQRLADLTAKLAAAEAVIDEIKGIVGIPATDGLSRHGLTDSLPDRVRYAHREWLHQTHSALQKQIAAEARAERAERERDALIEAWPELDDGEEGASRRVWAANGLWWAETADGLVPESSRDAAVRVAAGLAPADEPAKD